MGRHSLGRLLAVSLVTVALGCRSAGTQPYHADPFASSRGSRLGGSSLRGNSRAPATTRPGAATTPPSVFEEDEQPILQPKSSSLKRTNPPRSVGEPAEDTGAVIAAEHRAPAPRPTNLSDSPMDHAPDYSWIQGRLEYSALGGGVWKVRYAPLSADDTHGGSVILDAAPASGDFQPGDTVYVEGQLTAATDRRTLRNPSYRVRNMVRVEDSEQPQTGRSESWHAN